MVVRRERPGVRGESAGRSPDAFGNAKGHLSYKLNRNANTHTKVHQNQTHTKLIFILTI